MEGSNSGENVCHADNIPRNNGSFRWTAQKDCLFLREVRIIEPYLCKAGSKVAGRKWCEVAENINQYDIFREMPRDQRSVREHFNKLLSDFKSKMRTEVASSGTSPAPLSEVEQLLEEIAEIMQSKSSEMSEGNLQNDKKQERELALKLRDNAMKTWGKTKKRREESDTGSHSDEGTEEEKVTPGRRRKRRRGSDAFQYLEQRGAEEIELRREEMQFQREQATAERQRQELAQNQVQMQQQQMAQMMAMMAAVVDKLSTPK